MLKLPHPAYTAKDTFKKCISRVKNAALKARLSEATEMITVASHEFEAAAQQQALHGILPTLTVGGLITKSEMEKTYTQRMSGKSGPGRPIYDVLFSSSPNNRCPLCGHREVKTLDHHLPKAHYPALAVAPLNLVPSCTDCNKSKSDAVPASADRVSLHPYFDDITNVTWLRADVIQQTPSALQFTVAVADEWSPILQQRVLNHFSMLKLGELYANEAAEELLNIRHELNGILQAAGGPQVQEHLHERALSCAQARRNGWRTAAYTAWANSAWFCEGGF